MRDFTGWVLTHELAKKSGVSHAFFTMYIKEGRVVGGKMGETSVLLVKSLSMKYQEYAKECLDLEFYRSVSYLADMIGLERTTLLKHINRKKIETKRVGRHRLVEVSREFVECSRSMQPFLIRSSEDREYALCVVEVCGLLVGFY